MQKSNINIMNVLVLSYHTSEVYPFRNQLSSNELVILFYVGIITCTSDSCREERQRTGGDFEIQVTALI